MKQQAACLIVLFSSPNANMKEVTACISLLLKPLKVSTYTHHTGGEREHLDVVTVGSGVRRL